jgi:signal peptidase I
MSDSKTAAKSEDSWQELVKTIVYAGLIAVVIRTFLFQPFFIPSGSMENTLLIGDYLFIEKFSYGYSRYSFPFGGWPLGGMTHGRFPALSVDRGDVVVFKTPTDNSTDFIKRVIGVPGDRIQMINDVLYLNDKPVARQKIEDFVGTLDGEDGHWTQYRETLPGGKSYVVLDKVTDGPLDSTEVFTVPAGHYFMMGDNRDNSLDSRADVGYVPAENLEGKAVFRFFSTDGSAHIWEIWKWPFAVRYSRLFTLVH